MENGKHVFACSAAAIHFLNLHFQYSYTEPSMTVRGILFLILQIKHGDIMTRKRVPQPGLCEGNPPVTGGFPQRGPVMRTCEIFFVDGLNKLLNKQYMPVICEAMMFTWRHANETDVYVKCIQVHIRFFPEWNRWYCSNP